MVVVQNMEEVQVEELLEQEEMEIILVLVVVSMEQEQQLQLVQHLLCMQKVEEEQIIVRHHHHQVIHREVEEMQVLDLILVEMLVDKQEQLILEVEVEVVLQEDTHNLLMLEQVDQV